MVQVRSMDDDLRNSLWSILINELERMTNKSSDYLQQSPELWQLALSLWLNLFKQRVDEIPTRVSSFIATLKTAFLQASFEEAYDLLEHVALISGVGSFTEQCNIILERELSAYRFLETQLVPVSNEEELASIERALEDTSALAGTSAHLRSAIEKLADRQQPDYRNSIKESISAVEAAVNSISGSRDTLGAGLKNLGIVHPALRKGFEAIYGWTNDADGILHALMEEASVGQAEARFMLVACSAFISLLVAKNAENSSS